MGFFNSIFGDKDDTVSAVNWVALTQKSQIDEIIVASNNQPIVIFKHSTRCSISRMALKQFESHFDLQDKITLYYLDLLNFRDISNEIVVKFNVLHQSPQLLLIVNGSCVYSSTHENIDAASLQQFV